ncbi:hypothetical protein [Streptomyces alboflavus]|uniref:hypothetical protein n=1 Tax=Streptomyces alboflavus TaxID=67267 RepID=UPI0036B73D87
MIGFIVLLAVTIGLVVAAIVGILVFGIARLLDVARDAAWAWAGGAFAFVFAMEIALTAALWPILES